MEHDERIKELQEELSKTKYNKRTQHAIGLLKAKIARLKTKQGKSSSGKKGGGYSVRKTGDATVVILGFPSVGKSTLLNKLTNQESKIGGYDFTTLSVIPGLMEYNYAKIQLLDIPGMIEGAASGKGRGLEIFSVLRNANLCLIIVDIKKPNQHNKIIKEVYDAGIRLNKEKPDVHIRKTIKGGIIVGKTVKLNITDDTIKGIMQELGFNNAEILIRTNIDEDGLIDCLEGNKAYIPAITVVNKVDLLENKSCEFVADAFISAKNNLGIQNLKSLIFKKLGLISIFMKEPGKETDKNEPLIMKQGCIISDVCKKLHRTFISRFKFARIWGKSAKFNGQRVMLSYKLQNNDVVELHIR
jgi:small GTP-binding protein